MLDPEPDWTPSQDSIERARVTGFSRLAALRSGSDVVGDYGRLWKWSTDELSSFWETVGEYFGIPDLGPALREQAMPGAVWFPDAKLNYAAEVFRARVDEKVAIVTVDERLDPVEVTWKELRRQVASLAATLRAHGVGPGDRVAAYLPNGLEAVVALLASASIGAVWGLCGLDYGADAAIARLGQLEPRVLIVGDSYVNAGRSIDRRADVAILRQSLSTVTLTIVLDERGNGLPWSTAVGDSGAPFDPLPLPFDHPLWVLFSSGTTGLPKGIVHGHGGIVLEQLKIGGLHLDLGPADRVFWHTTPSWMMWNFLVGTLLTGASIVCYEGSPGYPDTGALWALAASLDVTLLGTSPGYLSACRQNGTGPAGHDLHKLKRLGVTGSAFPAALQRWTASQLDPRVQIASSSGGTDVCTAFAGVTPLTPVWAGELSVPCLGVALDCLDAQGRPLRGQVGELVITKPMPSMPLGFWNDDDGRRYRAAYFETFPGIWRHGDWITITDRGSVVIHGRSDATINRHGIRMGSADLTDPVERLPQITEALAIGVEEADGEYYLPLFVSLAEGEHLDDSLREEIRQAIRDHTSPRHVPDEIIEVPGIPHTRTGKKLEVPVKRILGGADPNACVDPTSVDNPDLLSWYAAFAARRVALNADRAASVGAQTGA